MTAPNGSVELLERMREEHGAYASVTSADGNDARKDVPFPGGASYQTAVAIARSNIRNIADNFNPCTPPRLNFTSWRVQVCWALRTGVAALVGMVLAIALTENGIWAGQVLTPVVAIAVIEPTVGATLKASVEAFGGSLRGSISIVIAIAITTAVVPSSSTSDLRDAILFVFFVLAILLFTSRQSFALKEKKLACAVLILGAYLAMLAWESEENATPGWLLPVYVLLSVGAGCLCACVVSLMPLPGASKNINPLQSFALFEVVARLDFSVNAVKTLLETHISLVIRAEPAELKQAEVVLASLSENQVKIDSLVPFANLELWCLGWFSGAHWTSQAEDGMLSAIALSKSQIPILRAKQLALRSRSLKGRGASSNVQALWLHQVVPAWCSATYSINRLNDAACWHSLAPLFNHRIARYALPVTFFDGRFALKSTASDLNRTLNIAKTQADEAVKDYTETVNRARFSLFYLFGALHQCHKKDLTSENGEEAAADASEECFGEQDDPFASLAEASLTGGPGFVNNDSNAPASSSSNCSSLPTMHNPMVNPVLYGMEVNSFMDEHNLRYAHVFFVNEHFASCLQEKLSMSESRGDCSETTDATESAVNHPRTRYFLETLWRNFASNACALWKSSGMYHGPTSADSWHAALRQTVALSAAAILFFFFRDSIPQAHWAAITISFILTDFSKGLGASVLIGEVRLLGTTLGSMFGLFTIYVVFFEGALAALTVSLMIGVWSFAAALFRGHPTKGYGAVVSAFTAAIIAHGIYTLDAESNLTDDTLVLARIQMNFVGIFIFILAESCLWPISARTLINAAESKVILAVAHATSAALGLGSDDENVSKAKSTLHDGLSSLSTAKGLVDSADVEPTLWRSKFPTRSHILTLERLQICLDITSVLGSAFKRATTKPSARNVGTPERVTQAMKGFGDATLLAVDEAMAARVSTSSRLQTFRVAAAVASPLIALRSLTKESLLQQRNLLLLTLYNRTIPLSQDSAMGWMTVTFLCAELSLSLAEVGKAWSDAKAFEVPLC